MIELGRNAFLRPRKPPSTFADGNTVLRVVAGLAGVRRVQRERAVPDDDVAGALEIVVGAEAEVVVLLLRRRVDPAALIARERPLLVVAGDDVLAQLGPDRLEQVAEVADDREVAQDRVPRWVRS